MTTFLFGMDAVKSKMPLNTPVRLAELVPECSVFYQNVSTKGLYNVVLNKLARMRKSGEVRYVSKGVWMRVR